MPVSPSTDNYYVGKGKISFKAAGESTFRDLGNVSSLETTPEVTTLEHFSSRSGVRLKDKEVITEKKLSVTLVMDEWTADNLAMALMGEIDTDTEGNQVIDIFSRNAVEGELKYEGANEIGPQMDIHLNPARRSTRSPTSGATSRSRVRRWQTDSANSAPGPCERRLGYEAVRDSHS